MKVYIRGKRQHSKHQLHVSTYQVPNWFEKIFMFRRSGNYEYVGKGTKWFRMTIGRKTAIQYKPVTNKHLLAILKSVHP